MVLTNLTVGIKKFSKRFKDSCIFSITRKPFWVWQHRKKMQTGGSIGILQKATKLCFSNKRRRTMEGASKGNQKLLLKYQRHGPRDMNFNMFFDKKKITMHEV